MQSSTQQTSSTSEELCALCQRPLGKINVDEHHLVPKTFKGKATTTLHKICHNKIHATFTERELLNYYHTAERLLENEDIVKFVKWVKNKDSAFYDNNKDTAGQKSKRR